MDHRAIPRGARRNGRFLLSAGFHFVLGNRIVRALGTIPVLGRAVRLPLWSLLCFLYHSEIALDAVVGGGLYVPHPHSIVIGPRAIIGRNVTILQGVTIGMKSRTDPSIGQIDDGVYLGAGAVVIGGVRVGRRAVVGALSAVVKDVPAGATVGGNPARLLSA